MALPQIKWDQRDFILPKPLNSLVWKKKSAIMFLVKKEKEFITRWAFRHPGTRSYKKKRESVKRRNSHPPDIRLPERSAPCCTSKWLCLIAWQVKQYSTTITITYHWIKLEPISRCWTRETWLLFFAMGENRGASLEDYWCEILSYSVKIYHFMCVLGHIDVFPLQPITSPLSFFLFRKQRACYEGRRALEVLLPKNFTHYRMD